LPLFSRDAGSTRPSRWIFKGDKNPQYDFLQVGSKTEGLVVSFYGMLKIPAEYDRDATSAKFKAVFSPTPSFAAMCLWCNQRALVNESGVDAQ
jgi:hypothetical protein